MITLVQEELQKRNSWVDAHIRGSHLPFSFVYGGKLSYDYLSTLKHEFTESRVDTGKTRYESVWNDLETGLVVTCVAIKYDDYPAVEWTVYFKNAGSSDTEILENIQGLEVSFEKGAGDVFTLSTIRGDDCSAKSYQPISINLSEEKYLSIAPLSGKPSNHAFPYFNIGWGMQGVIAVVGWPGQWAAHFACDEKKLHIKASQELTRLYLKPGEQIRTPLSLLMFWEGGSFARAQNLWRRFMIDCNIPRWSGKRPWPISSISVGLYQSEKTELEAMRSYSDNGFKQDVWWMDAGWFPCVEGKWNRAIGTWEADKERFPNGIKAVADAVHADGRELMLWFEPETACVGSWIYENHPEWLTVRPEKIHDNPLFDKLLHDSYLEEPFNHEEVNWVFINKDMVNRMTPYWGTVTDSFLVDLGNPETLDWFIEHFNRFIAENGVDIYRQDSGVNQLPYWRAADTPDRQGITENMHVQGYLKLWDSILERNPGIKIDSCASGGRRNDLETLRRAVPFVRSDYEAPIYNRDQRVYKGNQCHTYGLAMWVPYYGSGVFYEDRYSALSHLCPNYSTGYNYLPGKEQPVDWERLHDNLRIWKTIADNFFGDFYHLTEYSLEEDVWMAWQFDRPEAGEGFVQAFRREFAAESTMTFKLNGLDESAMYDVIDVQKGDKSTMPGKDLINRGLTVVLPYKRQAAVVQYKRVQA